MRQYTNVNDIISKLYSSATSPLVIAWNTTKREGTVDLLIKVACFVKE